MKKYSCYEYEIVGHDMGTEKERYYYIIYLTKNYLGEDEAIESEEWFDTEQEAESSVIKHINLLENGES